MNEQTKKPNTYTSEFKESTVKLILESEQPIAQTARDLGINPNTIHTWINKYSKPKTAAARSDEHIYNENDTGERFVKKGHSVLCKGNSADCKDTGGRVMQEQLPKSTRG